MKILVIPSWHPAPQKPLWCTWVLPHIVALREAGYDVYVLQVDIELIKDIDNLSISKSIQMTEKHLFANLPIKNHKYLRSRFFYGKVLDAYTNKVYELYKQIENEWGKPDVIHAHVSLPAGYGAAKLGQKENIPVVVTEHYSGFESDAKYWWRVGKFVKEMGGNIQGFYAVSPGFAQRIEATGLVDVTGVLPNPIDTEAFHISESRKEDDVFQIVTVGSASKIKGIDILFEALKMLLGKLDWHLTLFGNFENHGVYDKWFNDTKFSKRVSLAGKVSQKELVKVYNNSDLYVVSSRIETANVSMLEAMACGLPVVSTRCGAPETLLDESVSITVPSEDPKAMAEAILTMSKSLENYKKEDLRDFVVKNYSKKTVVDKMIEAYNEAIRVKYDS